MVGDRVIRLPRKSPYQSLRWPGVGFSPLPHLLRFDGRSLLKGIKSLWYMMCNLFSLYVDNYNWIVYPSSEIDISNLVDTDDIDDFPGKPWLVKATQQGQQVVRMIDRKSATGDTLASLNFTDQRFQEGVMINYAAQGLPGYRPGGDRHRECQQPGTVSDGHGSHGREPGRRSPERHHRRLGDGGAQHDPQGAGRTLWARRWRSRYAAGTPTGLKLPHLTTGSFSVSGAAALMRNSEVIQGISNLILPLLKEGNIFIPYIKPYALLKSLILRLNLEDEKIIVDVQRMPRGLMRPSRNSRRRASSIRGLRKKPTHKPPKPWPKGMGRRPLSTPPRPRRIRHRAGSLMRRPLLPAQAVHRLPKPPHRLQNLLRHQQEPPRHRR